MSKNLTDLFGKLAEPFPVASVKWKAQAVSQDKTRALAVAYVDARDIQARLDGAIGAQYWTDEYEVLTDEQRKDKDGKLYRQVEVQCALTVSGVTKHDVGDGRDLKAAYSDALKRAAVKFGIGRYLYSLPKEWCDYDDRSRQLKRTPLLPDWARPAGDKVQPRPKAEPKPDAEPKQSGESADSLFRPMTDFQRRKIHGIGAGLWDDWHSGRRAELVGWLTNGRTESLADLSEAEASSLIEKLERKEKSLIGF